MDRWGLGVRISDARDGDATGVTRQETDGRALVAARGGQVVKVYQENDTSAYKKTLITILPDGRRERRVDRPEFREALADLWHSRVDALAWYDLDRFVRDPRDLEDAIDVVEQTGRPIAAVTGSIDLSTDHGVTSARMLVAVANKSSRDTARRVKRMHVGLAEAGRPSGGRRPYGYTADRMGVVPAEAEILRELARRRLAGEGWPSMARDLNRRGIPAASGGPWGLSNIRTALLKPHVAGIRTLHGQETAPGVWPAILDRETWQQLVDMAAERPPPVRRYLLSGIAKCSICKHGLGGRTIHGQPSYRCANVDCQAIHRRMRPLDDYVTGVALGILADLEISPDAPADPGAAEQITALLRRRAATVAAFADLNAEDPPDLRRALDQLDAQLAALRAKLGSNQRNRILQTVQGISRDGWDALPLDVRRTALAMLVTVEVGRSKRGRVPFDAASVRVEPAW